VGRVISRVLTRLNLMLSSSDISPEANLGPGLLLPHPVAIVIGKGVEVGRNATIYQSVTLGVASHGRSTYPVLGDDVILYTGAIVVGETRINSGAIIGAGSIIVDGRVRR